MDFNLIIKEKVSQLLREGNRNEALVYLQNELKISHENAERLIHALEKENPGELVIKPMITKRAADFKISSGGCVALVLKGVMVFFGLITLTLFGFSILVYFYYESLTKDAVTVQGTVIEFRYNDEGLSAPVIEYEWNGETRQYVSVMYSNPPDYQLNEQVTLFINPENPDEILIDSFSERYLISIILAGVGTLFLVFTLILHFVTKKMK